MNPFDRPPRPPKRANGRSSNPFDDEGDDIVVELYGSPAPNHTNANHKDRPFPAHIQPRITLPVSPFAHVTPVSRPPPPPKPIKRIFGGTIPLSGAHSSSSSSGVYSLARGTSSGENSPYTPTAGANPIDSPGSNESAEVRSPFRFSSRSTHTGSVYQPARQQPFPGPNSLGFEDFPSSSSSSSEEYEEDSAEPEESESDRTASTSGPSTSSSIRNSTEVINESGVEMQIIDPSKKKKKKSKGAKSKNEPLSPEAAAATEKKRKARARRRRGKIVCVDEDDENKIIRFLVSEKVYGYPNTYGGRCSNYYYYVLYNHPVLSIFFTHRLHPFSKKHRLIVFLCSVSFAVCFAFILLNTPLVPAFQVCRSVCTCELVIDDAPPVFAAGNSSDQCVGGINDGRACSEYNKLCANYESWMLSYACGAATVVYESALHFLATCSCLQGRRRYQNNCCGTRFKTLVEFFGGVTLFFFAFLSFVFTLVTLAYCYMHRLAAELLLLLLLSELWSCVQWLLWALPWFLYKYPSDRRAFYEKLERRSKRLSRRTAKV